MNIYDRIYYRLLCYHRKCELLFSFQNDDRYYQVAVFMTMFVALVIFVILLVIRIAGIEDDFVPRIGNTEIFFVGIVIITLNCAYFLVNDRCRSIDEAYSKGGGSYSEYMDLFIDWFLLLLFFSMIVMSIVV